MSLATWVAGSPAWISLDAVRIWESVKVGRRPPRSPPVVRRLLTDGDAFALDLEFHLSQAGHDCEDYDIHGRFRVHVTAAEIQHPQSDIPFA